MTIIFVTSIIPFPVQGGEKIRSYGLLKILSKTFDEVIAVIGKTENEAFRNYDIENVYFSEFDFKSTLSVNKFINYFRKFKKNKKLVKHFDQLLDTYNIDIAFIDYRYYGQYIQYFKSKGLRVIYGTHNVQSKLDNQLPAVSIKNRISILLDYLINQLHERYYFRYSDALIAVSDIDCKYYENYISPEKIFTIPNFVIGEDYSFPEKKSKDYVIMTGNFLAYQNEVGLLWFINNVWKDKVFENEKLLLAGIGSDLIFERINQGNSYNNIKALGIVDDLKSYIAEAKVSIVPLLHGSGTRLKCVESMALKTQIISTSKGAEGIEHEGSIVIADTAELFKKQLINILLNKIDYTEKAYRIYKNKYSLEPNHSIFATIIDQIMN